MSLNFDQKKAIVRESVTAVAAIVASFNLLGGEMVSDVSALVIALAMWGLAFADGSNAVASFMRKAVHAVGPVLVHFGMVDGVQAGAISGILLVLMGGWTKIEKSESDVVTKSVTGL